MENSEKKEIETPEIYEGENGYYFYVVHKNDELQIFGPYKDTKIAESKRDKVIASLRHSLNIDQPQVNANPENDNGPGPVEEDAPDKQQEVEEHKDLDDQEEEDYFI